MTSGILAAKYISQLISAATLPQLYILMTSTSRSAYLTRLSPKGKAIGVSNTLSNTCGQPESSDSDEMETKGWESRSRTWMAKYELKVNKCIQKNQSPLDPFEDLRLLSTHSSAPASGYDFDIQSEFMSTTRTSPTRSEHSLSILASETHDSRSNSPMRTQPINPLPYLPPELASPHSHQPVPASLQGSSTLPAPAKPSAKQKQPEEDYYKHDPVIEDFSNFQLPMKKTPTKSAKHLPILPQALLKAPSLVKRRWDHSISFQSNASPSCQRIHPAEPSPNRNSKKVKEINTMADYEKLSRQERELRFPSVEIFATFLNSVATPKTKRSRAYLSGLDICYLLDTSIKQKLGNTDRLRMTKLSAAGAKLHAQPKIGLTTHIIIGGLVESWTECTEALRSSISDSQELQSVNRLIRGPDEGQAGVDIIWLLSIKWLQSCLNNSRRVPEKGFHIKPRNSRHAHKPTAEFNTSIPLISDHC
ncbi:uncharacterized protein MELLADRAFT_64356 [Melampsora larici-populina 98AG31]|uniref:BRCT domain-containing protein n=1 Tax=Melampsora larici-populina (strain 98AG31 / pathotype 3-4-7) TaxID=747676 RepID=F4RR53_MELLP|nr:uncharacterized protein MELLADRAFT_64356 [Melampsora larici-populina 98AG31]EGG05210.1 hypothetical protein MELLADRAFT_64356 [Melampsora larici-populina 98AG31]